MAFATLLLQRYAVDSHSDSFRAADNGGIVIEDAAGAASVIVMPEYGATSTRVAGGYYRTRRCKA
ncbi:hypothetical protein KCP76_00220 [Salmonella enterica subsp. enterica serovar Weltevreden]|nr:hypothetical protein KCP76_00220 [Salmonella enterica subsp. enterica serovar Weltevreden]